jgi:hypothetical protein
MRSCLASKIEQRYSVSELYLELIFSIYTLYLFKIVAESGLANKPILLVSERSRASRAELDLSCSVAYRPIRALRSFVARSARLLPTLAGLANEPILLVSERSRASRAIHDLSS